MVQPDQRVLPELTEPMVQQELPARKECPEHKVLKALRVHKARKAHRVHKVFPELQALMEPPDQQD